MARAKFTVEGPRWAGLGTVVREAAFLLDLDLSLQHKKHLIWETVFGTVTGDDEKILRFSKWLEEAIKDYNG